MPAHDLEGLRAFRTALHACFHRRADALFELTDALPAAESVTSLPHLSLLAAHRRGWGSLYDALAEGHLDVATLHTLLNRHVASDEHPVYAIDLSIWPRCDAEASPERGYYYHPSRHSAGQPIVAGWAYQWLAQLNGRADRWTTPLDVQRLHPRQNATTVAVEQIKDLLGRLAAAGAPPLIVFDAGYDSARVTQGLAHLPVVVLVRLRADRCFYADPPPAVPSPQGGRPRQHGAKFTCADPATWPAPSAEHLATDEQYGTVRVLAWAELHPKHHAHSGRAVASDDPFFFVDLENGRDPRTGAVAPWAAQVLARFQHTYQEVSPRATGFKVLGRGMRPGDRHVYHVAGGRPGAKVEVFDAVKYTTLTGHRLPWAPAAVRNAQAALDALDAELFPDEGAGNDSRSGPWGEHHDHWLLDRARQARTGAAFCRLFDAGDLGDHGGDPQRGEPALLTMLAAWCSPDRARLDRLFRRSALMGERWDARPDGESRSYGDGVIDTALAALADVPSPTRDPSRSHHH
jgi:hypothetical protein